MTEITIAIEKSAVPVLEQTISEGTESKKKRIYQGT